MGHAASDTVSEAVNALKAKLAAVENELVRPETAEGAENPNEPSRLTDKLAGLAFVPSTADSAPTRQSYQVFEDLTARTDAQLRRLREIIETDVAAFANLVRELEIPAIRTKSGS